MMNNIKNFIYLDDYKMYSISSQIFEGMTEYIIKSSSNSLTEKDEQKGNIGSGRLMADIIEKQKNETEKIFFHDYSYSLFENKLIEADKVLAIDKANLTETLEKVQNFRFLKITGRMVFNDSKVIGATMSSFNELGINLTRILQGSQLLTEVQKMNEQIGNVKDKNQKAKLSNLVKNTFPNIKEIAAEKGLQMEDEYLKALKYIINYGYNDQYEVQIPFLDMTPQALFSAILKRDKLKEDEQIISKKYGRISEKDFTIFGLITQSAIQQDELKLFEVTEHSTLKESILNITRQLSAVENTFTGKLNYEYIIDPIAIYQEL